jgi:hypothetical protein
MTVLTMLNPTVALEYERTRREALSRTRLPVMRTTGDRPVRRWVGRRLVALGSRLANEPPMRPVRAR